MKLTTLAVGQSADQSLSPSERAQRSCQLAKQLEKAGEYEAAYEALSEFWPEREGPPMVKGLDRAAEAQVLLRIGSLAGWLGSSKSPGSLRELLRRMVISPSVIGAKDPLTRRESILRPRSVS